MDSADAYELYKLISYGPKPQVWSQRIATRVLGERILSVAIQVNKIDHFELNVISNLTHLQFLDLSSEQLNKVESLGNLKSLKQLKLDGTGITDVRPLSGLNNLHTLDLSSTPVSDLAPIAGMTALQMLYLTNAQQVSDISPLLGHTSLEFVDLTGTQVTADKITALRESLPNCQRIDKYD